jgi:hypothetical protein
LFGWFIELSSLGGHGGIGVGREVDVAEQPPRVPHQRQLVGIDGRQDPAVPVACGFHVAALGGSIRHPAIRSARP